MLKLTVGEDQFPIQYLDKGSSAAILYVPGASGKAFTDKRCAALADRTQCNVLRYESWQNEDELNRKTLSLFHKELHELISFLTQHGNRKIYIVGKSLGGGLSVAYHDARIRKMVLWAPAIGLSKEGNLREWKERLFGEIKGLQDIKVGHDFLRQLTQPILIIHGDADTVMPLDNSKEIIKHISHGKLFVVNGADHSYTHSLEEVVAQTIAFLS